MPTQSFGLRNIYRPGSVSVDPLSWSRSPYGLRDNVGGRDADSGRLLRNVAYEWPGRNSYPLANPPFTSGAAGRLSTMLDNPSPILRGFIRRAQVNGGDPLSRSRLYFMYNPANIERQYIAYLDQQALDPFNTIYGSANLVTAPGFMDFSFSLLFDRQDEASRDPDNEGVYIDYQYFDMVVRNVAPQEQGGTSALQDNGVLLINPRDITVVFSPKLTVQGRAYNASVKFDKFTSRMIPTRMWLTITMKVLYIGPERPQTDAVDFNQELRYEITVPYHTKLRLSANNDEVTAFRSAFENSIRSGNGTSSYFGGSSSGVSGGGVGSGAGALAGALGTYAGVTLTDRQILTVVQEVGVPRDQWALAIAICLAESSGRVDARGGPNTNGTYDWGLWQINDIHASYDKAQLTSSPAYNARAMYDISSGGTRWTPWSAFNNGAYQQFMPRAQTAVQEGGEPVSVSGAGRLPAMEASVAPGNAGAQANVLEIARKYLGVPYVWGGADLSSGVDCSGFVWACYREAGLADAMGWNSKPSVGGMVDIWNNRNWDTGLLLARWAPDDGLLAVAAHLKNTLRPGDLLLRYQHKGSDHVGFFSHWEDNAPIVLDAASDAERVSYRNLSRVYRNWVRDSFNWAVHPRPIGSLMQSRGGTP